MRQIKEKPEKKPENLAKDIVQILSLDKTENEKVLDKISGDKEFVEQVQANPTLLIMIGKKINGRRQNLRNQGVAVPEDIVLSEGMAFDLIALAEKPVEQAEPTPILTVEEMDVMIAKQLALAEEMECHMAPAEKPTGNKPNNGMGLFIGIDQDERKPFLIKMRTEEQNRGPEQVWAVLKEPDTKRSDSNPAKTNDWKNPVEKPMKETPATQPKGGELLWSGEKPKEKTERVFVPKRKNRGTKPPKPGSSDLKNAEKILGAGLKISEERVRSRTPEIQKRTEEIVSEDPDLGKIMESDAPTQKQRYEGTVINLYKVSREERPIDKIITEEKTEYVYPLFNHPVSLQFLKETMTDESVELINVPEGSASVTGKFFANLVSTMLKSKKEKLFSIQLKYLGPVNGHQVLEPMLSKERGIPEKGSIFTSSLKSGKMLWLKPIETTP